MSSCESDTDTLERHYRVTLDFRVLARPITDEVRQENFFFREKIAGDSDAVVHTFDANLMTYEPSVPTDDKMTATVTFRVTGVVTRESLLDSPGT